MKVSTMNVRDSLNLKNSELTEFLIKIIDNNLIHKFHGNYEIY